MLDELWTTGRPSVHAPIAGILDLFLDGIRIAGRPLLPWEGLSRKDGRERRGPCILRRIREGIASLERTGLLARVGGHLGGPSWGALHQGSPEYEAHQDEEGPPRGEYCWRWRRRQDLWRFHAQHATASPARGVAEQEYREAQDALVRKISAVAHAARFPVRMGLCTTPSSLPPLSASCSPAHAAARRRGSTGTGLCSGLLPLPPSAPLRMLPTPSSPAVPRLSSQGPGPPVCCLRLLRHEGARGCGALLHHEPLQMMRSRR